MLSNILVWILVWVPLLCMTVVPVIICAAGLIYGGIDETVQFIRRGCKPMTYEQWYTQFLKDME